MYASRSARVVNAALKNRCVFDGAGVCAIAMRHFGFTRSATKLLETDQDLDEFLSTPTWSVESLLPSEQQINETEDITPKQLHHLLRLSALPPPSSEEEQAKMLRDLKSQLHFVKEIQKVDVTGIEPLQSIKDETAAAEKESEINMETLQDALKQEEVVGRYHKRIRRKQGPTYAGKGVEDWDVLGQAPKKVGRYFVVQGEGQG